MNYTLQNDQLILQFSDHGAELISAKDKHTGQEYIWLGTPEVWGRHAPVLFPLVGMVNKNRYFYNGDEYSLGQHGFARDLPFTCTHQTATTIDFELTESKATLKQYPFQFVLSIYYKLTNRNLEVYYEVRNPNRVDMPFSIGAHPGFYCPQQIEGQQKSYVLNFEKPETLSRYLIEGGLQSGETEPFLEKQDSVALTPELFKEDAIVLKNLQSSWLQIAEQDTGKKLVTMHCPEFPFMGIWQKVGADFYCIEPWFGIADPVGYDGDIMDKEGIQILASKKTFQADYTIEFH